MILSRGETIALGIIGYKAGKSIGDITGLANVTWQSDNPQTARVEGHALTGVKPGRPTSPPTWARSQPARQGQRRRCHRRPLRVDPKGLQLLVGQGARIGTDLVVSRGDPDGWT